MLPFSQMADEHADTDSGIEEVARILKLKIPPEDHAALDSRVQDDVISTLRDEFGPEHKE